MVNNSSLVLHDLFDIKGGGERLVMELVKGIGADLMIGSLNDESFDLSTLPNDLINLNLFSRLPGLKTYALAKGFKNKTAAIAAYKNVIYSGVVCPLAVNQRTSGHNVYYCHSPPRFIYDKFEFYQQNLSWVSQIIFKKLVNWFQPQYEQAVNEMSVVITNSHYVKRRIKEYLNVDSHVVYPPCDNRRFNFIEQGSYYLSLARLDPLKKVDSIIEAFKKMPDKKLIVASGGPEFSKLKKLADGFPNITLTGWLEEEEMLDLLGRSIATIYVPEDEDFGMTPIESMSAGKPVICSDHGGMLESVLDERTGFYVKHADLVNQIIEKVNVLNSNKAFEMKSACEIQAMQFDTGRFVKQMEAFLK